MRLQEYRDHLQGQGITGEVITRQILIIQDFNNFLAEHRQGEATSAGKVEVDQFARRLIAEGRNTLENFSFLRSYASWLGQREFYVALIEVTDCHNALKTLADEIETRRGRQVRDQIFSQPLPPLGADEKERCAYTQVIMQNMEPQLSQDEARLAWFQVQHGIPGEYWRRSDEAEKEKFNLCGSIDAYLDLKRQERDAMLTRLRDEGKLWYTVEINDEALEYVRSDPEMEVGRRDGNRVYISKIPYNAVRYLHETDARMKRYYACHCPLLREAILNDQPISPEVCHCSLGHASHFLAGLGMELRGEVLESAVKGDPRCRFVFYLPDEDRD